MREGEKDRSRVDPSGRAHAGSQRQIQTYVNDSADVFSKAIAESLGASLPPSARLEWVSPLKREGYIEYRDGDFLRVLGIQQYESELLAFWPKGGPCWDALARIWFSDGHRGCMLVEAKSHVDEIYGIGCRASDGSRQQILQALCKTKAWLGVAAEADWVGNLYQSANRYAHLYFLRVIAGVDAFLTNVYFINDPHSRTTMQDWTAAVREVKQQLGLTAPVPFSSEVYLNAFSE
jgi:hypothetical protein